MNIEQLRIEKNKLSDLNQRLSLIKRQNPAFDQIGINQLSMLESSKNEKCQRMASILDSMEEKKAAIEKLQANTNQYNVQYAIGSFEKLQKEVEAKFLEMDRVKLEINEIKKKIRICGSPDYAKYCDLISEKQQVETLIKTEEDRQSLLTAFCYDSKQRRLLPINIKEELAHHLGSDWGTNLMKKYPSLLVSYTQDKVEIINADKKPEISTSETGGLKMYEKPSKNEKLADLMIEMYFKSFENILDKVSLHSTSGPDADFLGKKIALGLQQRGYLDHKVNGKLVTDILGIEKKLDQQKSPDQAGEATIAPQAPPSTSADGNENANTPSSTSEEKETNSTPPTSNDNEPELPEWYIKQLEADKIIENDTSNSLKMR